MICLEYDLTQPCLISIVISESGKLAATSVKALLRELERYDYLDSIYPPKKDEI